jgi:hypothetical protein
MHGGRLASEDEDARPNNRPNTKRREVHRSQDTLQVAFSSGPLFQLVYRFGRK